MPSFKRNLLPTGELAAVQNQLLNFLLAGIFKRKLHRSRDVAEIERQIVTVRRQHAGINRQFAEIPQRGGNQSLLRNIPQRVDDFVAESTACCPHSEQ